MSHYLVLRYGIHSAEGGFISSPRICWEIFTGNMWKLLLFACLTSGFLNKENRLRAGEQK